MALRPDLVKVDRSLVDRIDTDPHRRTLLSCIVAMARDLDARVVAEGVESLAQLEVLQRLGVSLGQGWLFGRPAPASDAAPQARRDSVPWWCRSSA
jgi:EAL domain-containing protein (putative c-di-GMP-specific phosphodiesterase class I)